MSSCITSASEAKVLTDASLSVCACLCADPHSHDIHTDMLTPPGVLQLGEKVCLIDEWINVMV